MTGPKVLIVIVWILKGAVSNKWDIKMPQKIDVMSGFCVQIPCTFEIPDSFTKYLNKSVEAVWKKTDPGLGLTVFSSNSVASVLKGRVTGNLLSKNCTTVFENFPDGSNDTYFFRLQGPAPLMYTFLQGVNINVHADLLAPMLSPHIDVLEVSEGQNVTLTCSTVLSCPSQHPVMHWSVTLGEKIDPAIQVDEFGQMLLVSSQMFNASSLNDGLKVSCFLVYSQDVRRPIETSITLRVLYTPQNTIALANPPGPVYEGNVVTLSCQSDANPAVKRYEWFKQTGNGELVLKAQKQTLTMKVSSNVLGLYVCKAHNIHGTDQSTVVTVDLKGCPCTAPYIMCGVLTGLLILITVVDLVKYKSLMKQLKWAEDLRGQMAYATLNRTNDSHVYNEIQIRASRTEEDFVNKN
ncbi:Schwann cell myelin protein [Triplophysa dalaica]|uniref:Schwann cell myelin protein n=1 Tax=Triplophysa dalaica TaxID=1582913 RepID=UPI0024DF912C|nr:Schwann cell myelin protein [Triplophysa dalaica]